MAEDNSGVRSGKREFVCTFTTADKRALSTATPLEVLQMGAIRAWSLLLDDAEEAVLDAIEGGEVAHMAQTEDGHQLVSYEYEAGKLPGEALAFVRVNVAAPVTSVLLGVLRREGVGPNEYAWRMYPIAVTAEK